MSGWLVNDTLTCIPGTRTFWHNLLEWIPSLKDATGGYTPFNILADSIEHAAGIMKPDYIIRNASYFRRLNIDTYTISLVQDPITNQDQIDVCNHSDVVVFNSDYTYEKSKDLVTCKRKEIIPLGVDFDLFKPSESKAKELGILENSVLFVGADNEFKGFELVKWFIEHSEYNFCLVMKDGTVINNDRCVTFNRVPAEKMVDIYNSCSMLLCMSAFETQHLASIEAGACNLPIVSTDVGIHFGQQSGDWGEKIDSGTTMGSIRDIIGIVLNYPLQYNARQNFLDRGLDLNSCKTKWKALL